ncbi:hypothetical protein RvY_12662 [Ramazzottius varieornatus]|uniref:Tyrosine--tRNA ligase n=1 Tax=Ramazzottius varieornatus TaxID=947166 RepID=A0A1D1VTZ4_RAMVA|nr:hypothetical protein RvY_12662 [Ramazzottius varieornatus]
MLSRPSAILRSPFVTTNPCCRTCHRPFSSLNLPALHERGLIKDMLPDTMGTRMSEMISKKETSVYAGFDPTASSLHVGNLLPLIGLLHFQRAGIKPIVVIGGATATIGDPSGKKTERERITSDIVDENAAAIRKNIDNIFANHKKYLWQSEEKLPPFTIVNNMKWYKDINAVDFLGNVGRHIRIGGMLLKDSVQTRLNSSEGMSFAEFSYQAFQAYDWLHLLKTYNCFLQIGGSDQMGNMKAGYDLIRKVTGDSPYSLTVPLITTETGDKFGKSAGNAVWLDSEQTSTFDFYQFFLRSSDNDAAQYLKLFSFIPEKQLTEVLESHHANPGQRKAQKKLAEQATLLVHGEEGLKTALQATEALFNSSVEALSTLNPEVFPSILGQAFVTNLPLNSSITVLDTVMQAKCFQEEKDARRVIGAGGVYINHQKTRVADHVIQAGSHILPNNITLIRIGKKNHYVVRWRS